MDMKTKNIFKVFFAICFAILSCAYFLWAYEEVGISFTARCFFTWGFCFTTLGILTFCIYNLTK